MAWVWEEHSQEMSGTDLSESDVKGELQLVKVIHARVGESCFQMKSWPIKMLRSA